jgi:RNA polymerase sigma factor (sigma-70 family)
LADSPDGSGNLAEQFPDDATSPDEQASQDELCLMLRQLLANLPDAERQLINLTYFEGLTITEASDQLGRSKSWGSRTHSRILERLGRSLADEKTAWLD